MKIRIGAKILSSIFVVQLLFGLTISISQTVFADASKNLQISAIVPPRPTDFQFEFTLTHDSIADEDNIVSYKLIYGAKKSAHFPTNTTLTIDWNTNSASNYAEVFDYLDKSATNAYGDTKPFIDMKNHEIIWTINQLPAGVIDQSVSFKLKLNESLNPNSNANTVRAKMNNQYIEVPSLYLTNLSFKYIINSHTENEPYLLQFPNTLDKI